VFSLSASLLPHEEQLTVDGRQIIWSSKAPLSSRLSQSPVLDSLSAILGGRGVDRVLKRFSVDGSSSNSQLKKEIPILQVCLCKFADFRSSSKLPAP
jgi:hypothetical protein